MTATPPSKLRSYADDADQHGNHWVPISPASLRGLANEFERCATALRIAREGYASEAATGLPVLPQWRDRVIALIDEALAYSEPANG